MSYQKISVTIPQIADALTCICAGAGTTAETEAALLASGVAVELDDGNKAWVACVVQDNPETPFTEVLTACIALNADNTIRTRSGEVPVHRLFWHGADPVSLASRGLDAVRKDLMLMALGEQPVESDDPTLTAQWLAERSIRVAVDIADAVAATPTDVL